MNVFIRKAMMITIKMGRQPGEYSGSAQSNPLGTITQVKAKRDLNDKI